MIVQYPHSLYVSDSGSDEYVDGAWQSQPKVWRRVSSCRFETSGRSTDSDNDTFKTGVIYAPTTCPMIHDNAPILVVNAIGFDVLSSEEVVDLTERGECKFNGLAKGFDKNVFHTRIWCN